MTASVTPTAGNEIFFYLKNTGTDVVAVESFTVVSSVPTRLEYIIVTGTPIYVGEAVAQSTNLNLASSNVMNAEHNYGTSISGLTETGLIAFEECAVADTRYALSPASKILIPQGRAIAIRRVEATGQIDVGLLISVVPS